MPPSPADAFVAAISREQIGALAQLYDRFTHALDPYSPERDQAELVFHQQIAERYDQLPPPKPDFQSFRKGFIVRCRRHLRATDKPASV